MLRMRRPNWPNRYRRLRGVEAAGKELLDAVAGVRRDVAHRCAAGGPHASAESIGHALDPRLEFGHVHHLADANVVRPVYRAVLILKADPSACVAPVYSNYSCIRLSVPGSVPGSAPGSVSASVPASAPVFVRSDPMSGQADP